MTHRTRNPAMAVPPPLPHRRPDPDDYLELGQKENPRVWLPVGIGLLLVPLLLLVATLLGRL
jgi:hypothetical protein